MGRPEAGPALAPAWIPCGFFCLFASFISFCFLWDAALGILRRSLAPPAPSPLSALTVPPTQAGPEGPILSQALNWVALP